MAAVQRGSNGYHRTKRILPLDIRVRPQIERRDLPRTAHLIDADAIDPPRSPVHEPMDVVATRRLVDIQLMLDPCKGVRTTFDPVREWEEDRVSVRIPTICLVRRNKHVYELVTARDMHLKACHVVAFGHADHRPCPGGVGQRDHVAGMCRRIPCTDRLVSLHHLSLHLRQCRGSRPLVATA